MWDVVVIGAGLAGLTAARHLHQAGYRVLVVEKSRGLGGRLATRRVHDQPVDHGCRFLQPFSPGAPDFLAPLLAAGILQPWQPDVYELTASGEIRPDPGHEIYYAAPSGMTAVAKVLAEGLSINRMCRVTGLRFSRSSCQVEWVTAEGTPDAAAARGVIAAIPAPQILPLLDSADQPSWMESLRQRLAAVQFDPVLTVMAGFNQAIEQGFPVLFPRPQTDEATVGQGWMVFGPNHGAIRWAGLDSSKRHSPVQPVVVFHSSPEFATAYLEVQDLTDAGHCLLQVAAPTLGPWLDSPEWVQTHRWRYGFVAQPYPETVLGHRDFPSFVACGDWCGGLNAEAAFASGQKAASAIIQTLNCQVQQD